MHDSERSRYNDVLHVNSIFDTIVAPITGNAAAAVAVVRLSGPSAWAIGAAVFSPWNPEHMRARYGRFRHGDDGLALPFLAEHSYTGDETVELSIHGSRASVRELIEQCIREGARYAEPGEFTQRAFLNGRMDLTQAEAVRDLVDARTDAQLRLANLQREGSLRRRIERLRALITTVLANADASVDFSEEIGEFDAADAVERLAEIDEDISRLLESAQATRLLRSGLRVAILGPPNAGKSSLLNALLGIDRAIVTDLPGTTRDSVEESIEIGGVPVVLIDTAGLREPDDPVEALGIQRSRAIAAAADHMVYVYDSAIGWTAEDEEFVRGRSVSVVANKSDLARAEHGIAVSCLTGEGLAEVLATLPIDRDLGQRDVAVNLRHCGHLVDARSSVAAAIETLEAERPIDLISVLLHDALHALGEITGETAAPDMIHRIFADFCIGK